MVGAIGFEPTTPGPPDQCANRAAPRSDMFSIAQFRGLVNVSLAGYSIAGGNGPSEGAGRHVRSLRLTPFIRQWSFLSYLEYWIFLLSGSSSSNQDSLVALLVAHQQPRFFLCALGCPPATALSRRDEFAAGVDFFQKG